MFKAKLAFYGFLALLLFGVGLPALKNIGDGFQKDMSGMMDPNKMMNMQIDPNASTMETFVRMTPNGSKAIVEEANGFNSFIEGVFTFILVAAVVVGILVYMNYRAKAKHEAKYRDRFGSSRYNRYGSRW